MTTAIRYNNKEYEIELTDEQKKILGISEKTFSFQDRRNKEDYWTLSTKPVKCSEHYDYVDNKKYKDGFYFATCNDAKNAVKVQSLFLNIKRFQEYFDDEIIDFNRHKNKTLYFPIYNIKEDKVEMSSIKGAAIPHTVLFINPDVCSKAIEVFGEQIKELINY